MEIKGLLELCIAKSASDLHVTEGEPPILRIDGTLHRTEMPKLTRQELKVMIYGILSAAQKDIFERNLELDFSLALPGMDRFRVNIHVQKGSVERLSGACPWSYPAWIHWACQR